MSIIDLEQSKQLSNNKGISKSIDENALSLILDNVQISQYVYPEQSTVRELTSNAVDSQKEKEKAIEILTGKSKIEDHYITRDDVKYNDSNFNKDYYDLDKLDRKNNKIQLKYVIGKEGVGWCDKFVVRDSGVGLGDRRLEGYFNIGFSTKRNTVSQLGGFGIGAKVGLSLRNDYFTTETVHNSRKFKFNIYSYKVDSLISKFNLETNQENPFITFKDGNKVYYENTDSLNYTEITVPCKTHHKEKFKHAVESQLLYFDNVEFSIINGDNVDRRDIQAKVLYNSDNLIIADQYQYSKPHVIVVKEKSSPVGVSYGYINFREMEMQDLFGNVGFKCPIRQVMRDGEGKEVILQEGIEVTPSRESVIWSDATRAYVKKAIEIATEEANTIVEQQLKEDDFLLWLDKAKNVMSNVGGSSSNPTLKHLSNIIDKTQLSPNYTLNNSIKYVQPALLFWGFSIRKNYKTFDYKTKKDDMQRDEIKYWADFSSQNCYFQLGGTSGSKDFYLQHTLGSSFTTIRLLDDDSLNAFIKEDELDEHGKKKPNQWTKAYVDSLKVKRDLIIGYLKQSKLFKSYDDVVVPEDWNKKFEETNKVSADNAEVIEKLTPLELRKLAEQTIVHTLRKDDYRKDNLPFSWTKQEIKIGDLKDDDSKIYYSYGDEDTIPFTTILMMKQFNGVFNETTAKFYRVSKSMPKKFLKKHKHIDAFYELKNSKQVTMSGELIHWTTAKLIHEKLDELKFMRNYDLFNLDVANLYKEVKEYKEANFHEGYLEQIVKYGKGQEFLNKVIDYTSKVSELQLFIRDHKDNADDIKHKSLELFGIDTIESSIGYNLEMYDKLQTLLNYAESVKPLFNHITILTDIKKPAISVECECLIKEVIESKGLNKFVIPEFKKDDVAIEVIEEVKEEEIILVD